MHLLQNNTSFPVRSIFLFPLWIFLSTLSLLYSNSSFAAATCVYTYFYIVYCINKQSSVHIMFLVGYSTFILFPALLNWYFLGTSFELFFITTLVSLLFLYWTKKTVFLPPPDLGITPKLLYLTLGIIIILLSIFNRSNEIQPLFPFLILLFSLSLKQDFLIRNALFLIGFIFIFGIYAITAWSGFGRTVIFSWIIVAFAYFLYASSINFSKHLFGFVPALGSVLLSTRDILSLRFVGFENALNDSAFGPYRRASTFIEYFNERGYDLSGFIDQILFTFLVFIPREIWPSKPFGFGYEYTVHHLSPSLIKANHSIASTLIGDHIYYLGYAGVFTSLFILGLLASAINISYRLKGLNGHGIIIFSASMTILTWGGMTSFSARIFLPAFVFFTLYIILNYPLTRKIRYVFGRNN